MNTEYFAKYQQLVNLRKTVLLNKNDYDKGLIEQHHIIPRCLNGEDTQDNLVNLFAKEHFIAHYYLWKAYEDEAFGYKLNCAVMNMLKGTKTGIRKELRDYILASKEYQQARIAFAKFSSETIRKKVLGKKNGNFGKHWYYDPLTNKNGSFIDGQQPNGWIRGRYISDEIKKKSNKNKGLVWITNFETKENIFSTKENAQALVETGKWRYGHIQKPMSDEAKQRIKLMHLHINVSDAWKYSAKGKNSTIKGKIRYINLKTGKLKYFSKDEKVPDEYVQTKLLNKRTLAKTQKKQDKRKAWLKETQEMADYYVQFGYEETCKKFNVHMSCESMLMRFIRARKKYGIRFVSLRTSGHRREFKKIDV